MKETDHKPHPDTVSLGVMLVIFVATLVGICLTLN